MYMFLPMIFFLLLTTATAINCWLPLYNSSHYRLIFHVFLRHQVILHYDRAHEICDKIHLIIINFLQELKQVIALEMCSVSSNGKRASPANCHSLVSY